MQSNSNANADKMKLFHKPKRSFIANGTGALNLGDLSKLTKMRSDNYNSGTKYKAQSKKYSVVQYTERVKLSPLRQVSPLTKGSASRYISPMKQTITSTARNGSNNRHFSPQN